MSKAAAKPMIPDKVTLDGVEYTRYEIVTTFLKSAISADISVGQGLFDNALVPPLMSSDETDDALATPEGYRVQYPWLYEYLYREKGMSRYVAINKWDSTKPLRIALGFPNDLKPYDWLRLPIAPSEGLAVFNANQETMGLPKVFAVESAFVEQSLAAPDERAVQIAEKEIASFSVELSGLTGLDISYVPKTDEGSAKEGALRIVLLPQMYRPNNIFKNGVFSIKTSYSFSVPGKKIRHFIGGVQNFLFLTAVRFTPYSEKQVDGYFLPNADNTIGMSICYIWQGHAPEMLRALVRECMLRSMGLPDATAAQSRGYLDLWNDPQDFPRRFKEPAIETIKLDEYEIPKGLSEYDRYFLGLLYNPAIKPGMSAIDVYHALTGK